MNQQSLKITGSSGKKESPSFGNAEVFGVNQQYSSLDLLQKSLTPHPQPLPACGEGRQNVALALWGSFLFLIYARGLLKKIVGWVERSRTASRREVKPNKVTEVLGFVPQLNLRRS